MRDPRAIVRKALITEKGTGLRETQNQYYFEVARDANKLEIQKAIETIFHVKVSDVRTMQVRGKLKRQGKYAGRRSDWKKAIVTLGEGQKIDLVEQA